MQKHAQMPFPTSGLKNTSLETQHVRMVLRNKHAHLCLVRMCKRLTLKSGSHVSINIFYSFAFPVNPLQGIYQKQTRARAREGAYGEGYSSKYHLQEQKAENKQVRGLGEQSTVYTGTDFRALVKWWAIRHRPQQTSFQSVQLDGRFYGSLRVTVGRFKCVQVTRGRHKQHS